MELIQLDIYNNNNNFTHHNTTIPKNRSNRKDNNSTNFVSKSKEKDNFDLFSLMDDYCKSLKGSDPLLLLNTHCNKKQIEVWQKFISEVSLGNNHLENSIVVNQENQEKHLKEASYLLKKIKQVEALKTSAVIKIQKLNLEIEELNIKLNHKEILLTSEISKNKQLIKEIKDLKEKC